MKRIILALLLLAFKGHGQTIPSDSAKFHINEKLTVCGKVYELHKSDKGTAFINFRGNKDSRFTAVIFAKDALSFNLPEGIEMNDKDICVTGLIKTYQGKTEMILNDVGQLQFKNPVK